MLLSVLFSISSLLQQLHIDYLFLKFCIFFSSTFEKYTEKKNLFLNIFLQSFLFVSNVIIITFPIPFMLYQRRNNTYFRFSFFIFPPHSSYLYRRMKIAAVQNIIRLAHQKKNRKGDTCESISRYFLVVMKF